MLEIFNADNALNIKSDTDCLTVVYRNRQKMQNSNVLCNQKLYKKPSQQNNYWTIRNLVVISVNERSFFISKNKECRFGTHLSNLPAIRYP